MGLFSWVKNPFSKKSSNKKTNNKKNTNNKKTKKRSALIFKNTIQKKNFKVRNTTFTKTEFRDKYNTRIEKFRKGNNPKGHLQIMFDPDAPNGEGQSGNKVHVHFLKLGRKKIFHYAPPSPASGTHNYYCLSINIDNEIKKKELYKKLHNLTDRQDYVFQTLKNVANMSLGNITINNSNIVRENHFKVKSD